LRLGLPCFTKAPIEKAVTADGPPSQSPCSVHGMPPVVKMVVCSSPCQRPSGPQLTPSITCRHAWCKCCRCVLGHLISARISFKRVSHMCRCSSVGAHAALKALTRAALQGQTCAQAHMSQAAGLPAVCVPCGEFRPVCVPLGQPLDWLRA